MPRFGDNPTAGPRFGEAPISEVATDIASQAAESTGRRALDAFTLGFGDEIIAGAQSLFGDADYGEALAESERRTQAFQEAAQERAPLGVDPVDIAGLATGGGLAFQGLRSLPVIRGLGPFTRSVAGGAGVGGIAAAGQPGTAEERLEQVPYGMGAGAVLAPLAQGAARVVGGGIGIARDALSRFTPGAQERAGLRQIARSMERADLDTPVAQDTLQRYGPQAVIADLPGMRRLAQQSVELEGEGRALAEDVLTRRNLEQGPRINRALRDAMDDRRDFYEVRDALMEKRRVDASPAYERIHAQTIEPTDRMRSLLRRDSLRKAYTKARSLATEDGVELPTYRQLVDGEADLTGVRIWDYIKRGLDEQAFVSRQPTEGMGPGMRRAVLETRRELLEDMDRLVDEYADARSAWAGPSRSMEVMEMGRDIYGTGDPEEFIRDLADMTAGERDFLRLGVVQETARRIGNVAENRDAAGAFWTKPNNQRKLAALFPRGENLTTFMNRMLGERQATETMREVLQKSPTAEREALGEQYAIENAPRLLQFVRQALRGDAGGMAEVGASEMARRYRVPVGQREAVARILFEQDPQAQLDALNRIAGAGALGRTAGNVSSVAAGGTAAAAGGRESNARRLARTFLGGS